MQHPQSHPLGRSRRHTRCTSRQGQLTSSTQLHAQHLHRPAGAAAPSAVPQRLHTQPPVAAAAHKPVAPGLLELQLHCCPHSSSRNSSSSSSRQIRSVQVCCAAASSVRPVQDRNSKQMLQQQQQEQQQQHSHQCSAEFQQQEQQQHESDSQQQQQQQIQQQPGVVLIPPMGSTQASSQQQQDFLAAAAAALAAPSDTPAAAIAPASGLSNSSSSTVGVPGSSAGGLRSLQGLVRPVRPMLDPLAAQQQVERQQQQVAHGEAAPQQQQQQHLLTWRGRRRPSVQPPHQQQQQQQQQHPPTEPLQQQQLLQQQPKQSVPPPVHQQYKQQQPPRHLQQQQQHQIQAVLENQGPQHSNLQQQQQQRRQDQQLQEQFQTSPVVFVAAQTHPKRLAGSLAAGFSLHSHQLMFASGTLALSAALKGIATVRGMVTAPGPGEQPSYNILMQPTIRSRAAGRSAYALDIAKVGPLPYRPAGTTREKGPGSANAAMLHLTSTSNEHTAARNLVEHMPKRGQTVLRVSGPHAVETAVLAVALARPLMVAAWGQDLAVLVMWNANKAFYGSKTGLLLSVFRCAVGSFPPEVLTEPPAVPVEQQAELWQRTRNKWRRSWKKYRDRCKQRKQSDIDE